jgi:hypothetical protein
MVSIPRSFTSHAFLERLHTCQITGACIEGAAVVIAISKLYLVSILSVNVRT